MKKSNTNEVEKMNEISIISSQKFTKGNWYLQTEADVYTNIIRCDNGKDNSIYLGSTCQSSDIEDQANAQLMAASPDLLKACLKVVNGGYGCAPSVEYMDYLKKECEQAIIKALTLQEKFAL